MRAFSVLCMHVGEKYCSSILWTVASMVAMSLATGCGGNGTTTPPQPQNTMVTVVLAGTANDQLVEFDMSIQNIALTSQSGKTISLLTAPQPVEFIHLNSEIEPSVTVSVPQDVYTSVTVTIGDAIFTCATLIPETGGLDTDTYTGPIPGVTVNLPSPIQVSGNSMGLLLNLLVASSANFPSCYSNPPFQGYSLTPTFSLTPTTLSSQPTGAANGKVIGLNGQVSSLNAASGTFVVSLPISENARTISVAANASTSYQGANEFSDLAVGTFVNMDGAIQSGGSLVATRIAVLDNAATTTLTGPVMFVSDAEPALVLWGRQQQGALFATSGVEGGLYFSFGNAVFQTSQQLSNLATLPFLPSFQAANMVPGQNVYLAASSLEDSGGFPYTPLSSVTLIPQTINGTVSATSNSGAFTIYTVELATYDLFPALATQSGQATLLNNPAEVQVYVDSGAQQLNSDPLAVGSTLRFYGLVFNDHGTLRMDCAQINDGVVQNPTANPAVRNTVEKSQAKVVRAGNLGTIGQTYRVVTPGP